MVGVPDSQLDYSTKTDWGLINTGNPLKLENFIPLISPLNNNKNHHSSGVPCVVTRVASRFSQVAGSRWNDRLDVGVRKYGAFHHRIGWGLAFETLSLGLFSAQRPCDLLVETPILYYLSNPSHGLESGKKCFIGNNTEWQPFFLGSFSNDLDNIRMKGEGHFRSIVTPDFPWKFFYAFHFTL